MELTYREKMIGGVDSMNLFFRLKAFLVITLFVVTDFVYAQDGVRIAASSGTADPSAMLDVISTAKGVLIPRMTDGQRTSIPSPATGLLVFQTNGTPGLYYNAGTPGSPNWVLLSSGALSGVGVTNYAARWTSSSILGTGSHSISVSSFNGTIFDANDPITVTILELPF